MLKHESKDVPGQTTGRAPAIRRRVPRPNRVNGDITRTRILDAAEMLFAEHGFAPVSLRSITAKAGVNVAAIHFHFASKEALVEAVINRRLDPINLQRISNLRNVIEKRGPHSPAIEDVLAAFIKPYLGAAEGLDAGRIVLLRFMARAAAEQDGAIQSLLREKFDPLWRVLVHAGKKALPQGSDQAINWGFFFLLGALYYVNPSRTWLADLSKGKCDAADTRAASHFLSLFLAGGLRALAEAGNVVPRSAPKTAQSSRKKRS